MASPKEAAKKLQTLAEKTMIDLERQGPSKRTSILKVFLTPDELKLIQVAAPLVGHSQMGFVREVAVAKASDVIKSDEFLASIRGDFDSKKK